MIKVYFCPSINSWEVDYISELFADTDKFEMVHFKPMEIVEKQGVPCALIVSHGLSLFNVHHLVSTLSPTVVIHLSDEGGADQAYYNIYSNSGSNVKFLYHQYNHNHIDYKLPHAQFPLGYISGMVAPCTAVAGVSGLLSSKQHTFAFVGQVKSDRQEMLDVWREAFGCHCVHAFNTNSAGHSWGNMQSHNVAPSEVAHLYSRSWLVPIGRGNRSLDCLRIYEAILSAAIPVVSGTPSEISEAFAYRTEGLTLVSANGWEEARDKCALLLGDEEKMRNIIDTNLRWWASINTAIVKSVREHCN